MLIGVDVHKIFAVLVSLIEEQEHVKIKYRLERVSDEELERRKREKE